MSATIKMIKKKGKVFTHGKMVMFTMARTKTIKDTDTVF